ncbi:MAG TPA: TonB-dependent receptor [Steroidobacteraceae bacterium]|jgi:outer membrane receptor protein involved in Fe transport
MTVLGARALLLTAASLAAPGFVHAQTVATTSAEQPKLEEITVTGSRIARSDGYEAPTPLTVVGVQEMQSMATNNVADAINTLPVFSGSISPGSTATTASTGASNINALNLRSLGANRTLVLLDGQRSVGATLSGLVDVNLIPQALVERVEVVTGGASAVYGSDALGGVVNFILDKKFTGLKGDASYGATTHGDGGNWKVSLTGGLPFADDRGHILASVTSKHSDSIPVNRRDWNLKGWQFMTNPNYAPGNGQPERLLLNQVAVSDGISGGIITDTALRGTAFGKGGAPYQFQYGDLVNDPDMRGGDWRKADVRGTPAGESLGPKDDNLSVFTRLSYDITDNFEVYGQFGYVRDQNVNNAFSLQDNGSITIHRDNPFIPASVLAMLPAGVDEFHMGSMHPDIPIVQGDNDRRLSRYVVGANGSFDMMRSQWTWDAYYQKGISDTTNRAPNMAAYPNYDLATDAISDPNTGEPICRSTLTDPNNGCVPYNPMGIGVNTKAAIDYVTGAGAIMWRRQKIEQDVAAASVQGEPFSTWAGPVSVAFGVEHRKEHVEGVNDDISDRFGWWVGGYAVTEGGYNVTEGFLETVVPLAKDLSWAKSLDVSGAVRETDYSTSGRVTTWKLGATYAPVDDIRFRVTRSRDIRAPNLDELISRGSGGAPGIRNPFNGGLSQQVLSPRLGNPNLTPEIADGLGVGMVLQPRFLPGFSASIDYWKLDINDAIDQIDAQEIIDRCYAGNQDFCQVITFRPNSNMIDTVIRSPFNYVTQLARGIDVEASYRMPLGAGDLSFRLLGTHYLKNETNDGSHTPIDTVGQNTADGPPDWRWTANVSYALDPMNVSLTARGISSGVYDNRYIECTSGCPTSSIDHVTVSDNHIDGEVFFDAAFTYKLAMGPTDMDLFVNVRNIFDSDPEVVAADPGGYSYSLSAANPVLYDTLGRVYQAGVRVQFK